VPNENPKVIGLDENNFDSLNKSCGEAGGLIASKPAPTLDLL
jgi:hypothetical protein